VAEPTRPRVQSLVTNQNRRPSGHDRRKRELANGSQQNRPTDGLARGPRSPGRSSSTSRPSRSTAVSPSVISGTWFAGVISRTSSSAVSFASTVPPSIRGCSPRALPFASRSPPTLLPGCSTAFGPHAHRDVAGFCLMTIAARPLLVRTITIFVTGGSHEAQSRTRRTGSSLHLHPEKVQRPQTSTTTRRGAQDRPVHPASNMVGALHGRRPAMQ